METNQFEDALEALEAEKIVGEELGVEEVGAFPGDQSSASNRWAVVGAGILVLLLIVAIAFLQFSFGPQAAGATTSISTRETMTTASGLQYEDTQVGSGDLATAGSMVKVHYIGWLEDGTQFDSSRDRGTPFSFQVGARQVIPGWEEGVSGMRIGGTRRLTIPPELAYGDQGAGGVIPPGATLIFEIELLDIVAVVIEDLVVGEGLQAASGNRVTLEYTVWFDDGTRLDSSAESGPIQFTLGAREIIPGLEVGVQGLRLGGKRLITIPPEFAFGSQGAGALIPPNTTLVFEVELIGLE